MKRRKPELIEMDETEFKAILERAQTGQFTTRDCEKLQAVYETLSWVIRELEEKNASLARLRKSLSINTKKTEKTSDVLKEEGAKAPAREKTRKKKPKGHGRNGASAYEGAEKTKVPHPSLKPGDSCPACEKGKVYEQDPSGWFACGDKPRFRRSSGSLSACAVTSAAKFSPLRPRQRSGRRNTTRPRPA